LAVRDDFLFFSLYSFSCIAKQVMTLKQLWLLFCPNSIEANFECPLSCFRYRTLLQISLTFDPAQYMHCQLKAGLTINWNWNGWNRTLWKTLLRCLYH
jgi:hypothetical protein